MSTPYGTSQTVRVVGRAEPAGSHLMAVLFTLVFIAVTYITPTVVFGPLAEYRVEVLLAIAAVAFSVPNIVRSRLQEAPQTYAFIGLCLILPLSILMGAGGWLGGAFSAVYGFLPVVLCFVLPAANFRKAVHFRWLVVLVVLCSAYFIYNGLYDLYNHVIPSEFIYGDGELRRIRGLGFVHDPNDLAQVMVSALPMLFLWRKRSWLVTCLLLLPPIVLLITGMYYTHSRGCALALMATLIIALRRKLGTVPAVILAGSLFAASLAVGWSGGRDVSVEAGGDRLDAWSTGIDFIKQHPLFGVGANRFTEYNDITAHNSVVVCAAEIGLPGFVCWTFMVLAALRGVVTVGGWKPEDETAEFVPALDTRRPAGFRLQPFARALARAPSPYLQSMRLATAPVRLANPTGGVSLGVSRPARVTSADLMAHQLEIRGIARILVCSLTGFLVSSWFLSRAFSMWLFLYCGLSLAVVRMAEAAGMRPSRDSFAFMARWSVLVAIGLLLMVYGILRFRSLTGR